MLACITGFTTKFPGLRATTTDTCLNNALSTEVATATTHSSIRITSTRDGFPSSHVTRKQQASFDVIDLMADDSPNRDEMIDECPLSYDDICALHLSNLDRQLIGKWFRHRQRELKEQRSAVRPMVVVRRLPDSLRHLEPHIRQIASGKVDF